MRLYISSYYMVHGLVAVEKDYEDRSIIEGVLCMVELVAFINAWND